MEKLTITNVDDIKNSLTKTDKNSIKVGMSTCGIAAGAEEIYNILLEESKKRSLDIEISKCGCYGMCSAEPLVEVAVKGMPRVIYGNVDKDTAVKIIDKHASGKRMINDHVIKVLRG